MSATVSTVNQANEEETQEGKNNNTLSDVAGSLLKARTAAVKPISSFVTKRENGVNEKSAQEVVVVSDYKKNTVKKGRFWQERKYRSFLQIQVPVSRIVCAETTYNK